MQIGAFVAERLQSQHVPQKQMLWSDITRAFGNSMIPAYFVVCYHIFGNVLSDIFFDRWWTCEIVNSPMTEMTISLSVFSHFLKEDSTFNSFYQTWRKWCFWIHEVFALEKPLVKVQPRPTRYRLNQDFGEFGNQQTHDFLMRLATQRPMSLHLVTPMPVVFATGTCLKPKKGILFNEHLSNAFSRTYLALTACVFEAKRFQLCKQSSCSTLLARKCNLTCSLNKFFKKWCPWTLNSDASCRLSEMLLFMTHSCWSLGRTIFPPLLTDIESLFPLVLSANLHHWTSRITQTE